ncbi:hypothetical protein M5K25_020292 [Dendrobium thyrsiflorum]|uniref:Uncharacterized protein n=1 Tax=Dendrobium thyrsiflorum TaxID=117978 RepID=A0ABD0U9H4_DENTH
MKSNGVPSIGSVFGAAEASDLHLSKQRKKKHRRKKKKKELERSSRRRIENFDEAISVCYKAKGTKSARILRINFEVELEHELDVLLKARRSAQGPDVLLKARRSAQGQTLCSRPDALLKARHSAQSPTFCLTPDILPVYHPTPECHRTTAKLLPDAGVLPNYQLTLELPSDAGSNFRLQPNG